MNWNPYYQSRVTIERSPTLRKISSHGDCRGLSIDDLHDSYQTVWISRCISWSVASNNCWFSKEYCLRELSCYCGEGFSTEQQPTVSVSPSSSSLFHLLAQKRKEWNVNSGCTALVLFVHFVVCNKSTYSFYQQVMAQPHEISVFSFIFKARLHKSQRTYNLRRKFILTQTQETTHYDNMSDNNIASLTTLPIELIYRILDRLTPKHIILSVRNVCKRLNSITDVYHPYQVNFRANFSLNSISLEV